MGVKSKWPLREWFNFIETHLYTTDASCKLHQFSYAHMEICMVNKRLCNYILLELKRGENVICDRKLAMTFLKRGCRRALTLTRDNLHLVVGLTWLGCVSLRFKGLPEGYRWGFPYLKNSKNCTKNLNIFFTSRWPGAKSAPVHQLAKKLYLRTWGHFKDRTPPHWASKNGEFPDFRLSETHPRLYTMCGPIQ